MTVITTELLMKRTHVLMTQKVSVTWMEMVSVTNRMMILTVTE